MLRRSVSSVKSAKDVANLAAEPFPVIKTFMGYKRGYLMPDTSAGLVEGVMKVPM